MYSGMCCFFPPVPLLLPALDHIHLAATLARRFYISPFSRYSIQQNSRYQRKLLEQYSKATGYTLSMLPSVLAAGYCSHMTESSEYGDEDRVNYACCRLRSFHRHSGQIPAQLVRAPVGKG